MKIKKRNFDIEIRVERKLGMLLMSLALLLLKLHQFQHKNISAEDIECRGTSVNINKRGDRLSKLEPSELNNSSSQPTVKQLREQ